MGITLVSLNCQSKRQVNYLGQRPPGMVAELFSPGFISTNAMEHSAPAFSPDGSVVLWTVVDSNYHGYLLESRFENGKWSEPQRPSFADSIADDYYPSFSIDGKKLYFSSRRKLPAGYPEPGDMRIWEVERTQTGWGKPMPFDTTVSKGQDYAHSITETGVLYYSSSLGGGTNWNLRRSDRIGNGYSKPVLLPFNINSVNYEEGPFIAPDESFLIFESQRPEGIDGSLDLYISFRNKDDSWNLPVNMGPKINSASAERFARISPDGKYLFFGSARDQSPGKRGFDIYWIDARVIDELRVEEAAKMKIEQPLSDEVINGLYRNDVEAASGLLKKWLTLYPNNLDATIIYSSILLKRRKYPDAQQLLAKHSSLWNNNVSFIMQMSLAEYGLERDNEAEKILAPVLVDKDQLRERYIYLSNSLLEMGKLKLSDEYFDKAMDIFSSSFPYFHRARALAKMGEKERAFLALGKAVEYGGINSRKEFEADPDFQSLHGDTKWKLLMQKLK